MNTITKESIPYWVKVVVVFFLGWIVMYGTRMILSPVMGDIQKEFNLNKTELGLINSVFFFSYAFFQIPAGVLGDKWGRKAILVPGIIFFGIMTAISGLATSFALFIVARLLTGIGQGCYYGPQFALSSEALPASRRGIGTAIINSGMAFGTAFGLLASGFIAYTLGYGWRAPFYVLAIPTIVVGLFVQFFIRENTDKQQANNENNTVISDTDNQNNKSNKTKSPTTIMSLFKNRNLVCAYIMVFCSLFGFFMMLTWLPYFLQTERGIMKTAIGSYTALIPWASIPGALLFAYISDKLGKRIPIVFLLVPIAALSIYIAASSVNINVIVSMLLLYGFTGKLALDPVLVSYVADNSPKESYSTAFGVFNFIGMCSSILAPVITGFLADKFGSLSIGFYLSVALLGVGFVAMLFAKEKPIECVAKP